MANDDLQLGIGFDVDTNDLDRAIQDHLSGLSDSYQSMQQSLQMLVGSVGSLVDAMGKLKDLAADMSQSFGKTKDAMREMRESIASMRQQAGLSGTGSEGGGGGGGGGGGIFGGLFGMPRLSTLATAGAVGTFLWPQISSWLTGAQPGDQRGFFTRLSDAFTGNVSASQQVQIDPHDILAPLRAFQAGWSPNQIASQIPQETLAGFYGMARGIMGGLGGGVVGTASRMIGGTYGAARGVGVGQNIAEGLGFEGPAQQLFAGVIGAEGGRQLVEGQMQRYVTEAMQRYPGFLQTMAGMAQVGLQGGDYRQILRMRPGAYGYGPEAIGGEFGGLYQGFGGGDLSEPTLRTSMAYSRAYGVGMGAIGGAVGGLVNIGGGGQFATEQQREHALLRVMTDAVSAGFGRRLPEFAQSVSSGVAIATGGPAFVRQDAMQDLIGSMSRTTGAFANRWGVGLQQAQRGLGAFAAAPGGALRGLYSGGGDPLTMGLLWGTNRERFGGNMLGMMDAFAEAQADPFSESSLRLISPAIQQILRQSPTTAGAMTSVNRFMTSLTGNELPYDVARNIATRGRDIFARAEREGRDPTLEEMREALTGIDEGQQDEGEQLRDTIETTQERASTAMREQLAPLRALAGYSFEQLGISAGMARDGRDFYTAQLSETQSLVHLMRTSVLGDATRRMNELRREGARVAQTQGFDEYLDFMITRFYTEFQALAPELTGVGRDEAPGHKVVRRQRGQVPSGTRTTYVDARGQVLPVPAAVITGGTAYGNEIGDFNGGSYSTVPRERPPAPAAQGSRHNAGTSVLRNVAGGGRP